MDDINYKAYQENSATYIDKNPDGKTGGLTPLERAKNFQHYLNNGKIFEIGSGPGLDALALQTLGFEVIPSDFAESFINILNEKGLTAVKFDAKKDKLLPNLNGVYANAVFLHFSPDEFKQCLSNIYDSLEEGGHLFMSLIIGEGTEISGRAKGIVREFYYYLPEQIKEILENYHFEIDKLEYPIDEQWIHIICHKKTLNS